MPTQRKPRIKPDTERARPARAGEGRPTAPRKETTLIRVYADDKDRITEMMNRNGVTSAEVVSLLLKTYQIPQVI